MKITYDKASPPEYQQMLRNSIRGSTKLKFPNQDRGPTMVFLWRNEERAKPPERGKLCLRGWKLEAGSWEQVCSNGISMILTKESLHSRRFNTMYNGFDSEHHEWYSEEIGLNFMKSRLIFSKSGLNLTRRNVTVIVKNLKRKRETSVN